jgi:HK97 family phage major capsid protein
MNAIKQLNEQRGQKLKDAQAIIETARGESRSLTPEEHNKVEGLHTEAENLTNTIAAEARQLALAGANVRQLSKSEERDVNSFDFAKIVNHLHRSAKGGVTTIDGIEAEMVQEGEREARAAGIQAGGIVLPRMLVRRENRDMTASGTTSTTGDQGGMTIATEKRGLLDDFFNASVLRGLGSTVLEGLVGNIDLPRLTAGTDPAKKAENASADEVSPTTAMLSLSPKRLPAYIDISERLLAQSSVAIEAILRNHLSTQMGAVREKSFWHGGGTNEPTGIAGTSGIGSVAGGTNGAAPTYAHILALEEAVDAQNALLGNLAYASNGQIRKKLKGTLENPSGTDATWILGKDGMINGYKAAFTNAISRTLTKGSSSVASAIFFGNYADFVEAYWGGISLEMVRDKTNAISGLYTLVATTYYDGGVLRPKSFAAMLDALGA